MLRCRDEIASCSEAAYTSLKMADAQKLMMFNSQKDVEAYAKQVRFAAASGQQSPSAGHAAAWSAFTIMPINQ